MKKFVIILTMSLSATPAFATKQYSQSLQLPCGQCHVNAAGLGIICLTGIWDKHLGTWAVAPKPMEECSTSPGGELTPFGQMFKNNGDKLN